MAKQIGDIVITGTYDDLCFYKMDGQYYVRMKSSLTRNRVRKSAAFANTMKSANELGTASVLASRVYRTIAKEKRKVTLYRKMTGMAKLLLKHGESKEQVTELLEKYIAEVFSEREALVKPLVKKRNLFSYINSNGIYHKRRSYTKRRKNNRRRRILIAHHGACHEFGEVSVRDFTPGIVLSKVVAIP